MKNEPIKLEDLVGKSVAFVKSNKRLCIWTSSLIVAGIADIYMTTNCAETIQQEANPAMRYVWENFGVSGMVAAKIGATSFLVYQAKKTRNNYYLAIPTILYSAAALGWAFR